MTVAGIESVCKESYQQQMLWGGTTISSYELQHILLAFYHFQ